MTAPISKTIAPSYLWGDQCRSYLLAAESGFSVKHEVMPLGRREQLHCHEHATQFFFVLRGTAQFFVESARCVLKEHEGLTVKSGLKHFVENHTAHELEFLVISVPATDNDRINL